MKEIKFRYRFQHKKTGEINGFEIYTLEQIEKGEIDWLKIPNQQFKIISRDLYTGFKDKNGKDIYESDICLSANKSYLFEVMYDPEMAFGFAHTSDSFPDEPEEIEVVGNIYENPELGVKDGVLYQS